jgi:hypothetical protein
MLNQRKSSFCSDWMSRELSVGAAAPADEDVVKPIERGWVAMPGSCH